MTNTEQLCHSVTSRRCFFSISWAVSDRLGSYWTCTLASQLFRSHDTTMISYKHALWHVYSWATSFFFDTYAKTLCKHMFYRDCCNRTWNVLSFIWLVELCLQSNFHTALSLSCNDAVKITLYSWSFLVLSFPSLLMPAFLPKLIDVEFLDNVCALAFSIYTSSPKIHPSLYTSADNTASRVY